MPFLFLLFLLLTSTLSAADGKPDVTVQIPMRDGTELPADIYLPNPTARNLPCILIRSPGGRTTRTAVIFTYLTNFGYAVAIQDTRSALDQMGKTLPYCTDAWGNHQDGYDTVQWLANSEFTNGKIGTLGSSALGITQLLMAPTAPPALKCQYIGVAAANLYHDAIYPGGQFLKNQVEGWLGLYARDPGVLNYVRSNDSYNAFWKTFDTNSVADRVKVPGLHYGGWYDVFIQGTLDAFVARQEKGAEGARGTQKLLIGPWTHMWPLVKTLGEYPVPAPGHTPPYNFTPEEWFNYHLKGEQNSVSNIPAVTYFVMGPLDQTPSKGNVWKTANSWPVPADIVPYYFTADHRLSTEKPKSETNLSYKYDPMKPTPTLGGRNLFLETGPKDQRAIEQNGDLLVFTTEPLTEDVEVTGRIIAKIFLSSDRPETDVALRLTDVYPDGASILVVEGLSQAKLIESSLDNKVHQVEVDLWSTSMVFAKGHSIRVSISSSNYPRHEKSMNGATEPVVANNKIHIGGNAPSHLLLPIVK